MNWLEAFYEHPTLKPYRFNPCDAGAFPVLQPFGRALARLAGLCPCCAGARLVTATVLAAVCPTGTPIALGVIYLALLMAEIVQPTKD